jgi:hypothetical protein
MGASRHVKWVVIRNFSHLQESIIILEHTGREVIYMNALEILAMVVAIIVCVLPGIMAWSYHFGGRKQASEKRQVLRHTTPANVEV